MTSAALFGAELRDQVRDRFDPVLVLFSPPRSGSTAMARTFWQHPAFRWYVHEPFDRMYHHGGDAGTVLAAMADPLEVDGGVGGEGRDGLVVKEMTFQAGTRAAALADAATLPVVVTVRDPRLAVASRMRQRRLAGLDPSFPPAESGWPDLLAFLEWLRDNRRRHVIVDTSEVRANPEPVLVALCEQLGLTYTPDMLSWHDAREANLGQLADEQSHWYQRVLRSTGIEPPVEAVPDPADFPPELRTHVEECLDAYRNLRTDRETLT